MLVVSVAPGLSWVSMTEELPAEPDGTIRCTDCGTKPDVVDTAETAVTLRCDCGTELEVTLLRDVPAGWSE